MKPVLEMTAALPAVLESVQQLLEGVSTTISTAQQYVQEAEEAGDVNITPHKCLLKVSQCICVCLFMMYVSFDPVSTAHQLGCDVHATITVQCNLTLTLTPTHFALSCCRSFKATRRDWGIMQGDMSFRTPAFDHAFLHFMEIASSVTGCVTHSDVKSATALLHECRPCQVQVGGAADTILELHKDVAQTHQILPTLLPAGVQSHVS